MNTFNLKIVTPSGVVFNEDIVSLETTSYKGRIGILANHVNFIGQIKTNILNIKNKSTKKEEYIVTLGYLFFTNNEARILTDNFVSLNEIDVNQLTNEINDINEKINKLDKNTNEYELLEFELNNKKEILSAIKK